MLICFCMNSNCCLSLSHSLPLVQYCVSPHCFQCYLKLQLVLIYINSLCVFFLPSPIQQHPPFFKPHCPALVHLMPCIIPFFHFCQSLSSQHSCISFPPIPLKARFLDSKHTLIGWGSRTHRSFLAGSRACSVWSWYPSTALCSWLWTLCFRWLTFALRSSWIKTFSSGILHCCSIGTALSVITVDNAFW